MTFAGLWHKGNTRRWTESHLQSKYLYISILNSFHSTCRNAEVIEKIFGPEGLEHGRKTQVTHFDVSMLLVVNSLQSFSCLSCDPSSQETSHT